MNKLTKYKFSDLYYISSGISSTKEQAGHGSPFVSFSTVFNNYFLPDEISDLMYTSEQEQENYSIQKGDILITRTSETVDELAMSCVALKNYPHTTYSGFTKRLRPKMKKVVYDRYIAFYLRSQYFRKVITNNTIMTLRASFNEDIFSLLDLYLPEYKEQKQIGDLLYLIEQKCRLNNRINDNLEQQMKLLYDYWFTQFDFPNENGNPYRSSGGKMVWNEKLKRDIPVNWITQPLASNCLTKVIKPGVYKFKSKTYLATADVNGTSISEGTITNFNNRESRANMQPIINSVWFAKMKNSIKHLYLNAEMSSLINTSILSTGFCGLQCSEDSFEYISSFISSPYFEIHKDVLAHGATQEAVNNKDLEGIPLVIPPTSILKSFKSIAEPIYAQMSENICENQKLSNFRDWLLPMLMNGQATIVE